MKKKKKKNDVKQIIYLAIQELFGIKNNKKIKKIKKAWNLRNYLQSSWFPYGNH